MEKQKGEESVIVSLSTGLADKQTKPRRVPQKYMDQTVKEVINYLERVIERDGESNDVYLVTCVHDQMKGGRYVVKMNEQNVDPTDNFGKAVSKTTTVKDVGEAGESPIEYREVNMIITRVEEGGQYDKSKDSELKKEIISINPGKDIVVGIYSYDSGQKKLQISRRVATTTGQGGFRPIGRMTKDEIEKILPVINKLMKELD